MQSKNEVEIEILKKNEKIAFSDRGKAGEAAYHSTFKHTSYLTGYVLACGVQVSWGEIGIVCGELVFRRDFSF